MSWHEYANGLINIYGLSFSADTTHEKIVIRRCTSETMDKQCGQFRLGDDLLKGCILTCDLDGCNSSNNLQHSEPLMLTMIGLFLILWTTTTSSFFGNNSSSLVSTRFLLKDEQNSIRKRDDHDLSRIMPPQESTDHKNIQRRRFWLGAVVN